MSAPQARPQSAPRRCRRVHPCLPRLEMTTPSPRVWLRVTSERPTVRGRRNASHHTQTQTHIISIIVNPIVITPYQGSLPLSLSASASASLSVSLFLSMSRSQSLSSPPPSPSAPTNDSPFNDEFAVIATTRDPRPAARCPDRSLAGALCQLDRRPLQGLTDQNRHVICTI